MNRLFSERHGSALPRVGEELTAKAAKAFLALVDARISENWFGKSFPSICPDGTVNAGGDSGKLKRAMEGYDLIWPPEWLHSDVNDLQDAHVFDVLEFSYYYISFPRSYEYHSYYKHNHFGYNVEDGQEQFQADVNRIFERQGLAFELKNGQVLRLAPTGLQEILASTLFNTGDEELDRLLKTARSKILDRSIDIRKEGLEKLWDAWERLKTSEPGGDKKAQAAALLAKASAEPVLRQHLEAEAFELTKIGNSLMIRYTEVGKPPIELSSQVDYLYHRMFAMIRLLLKSTGRGG